MAKRSIKLEEIAAKIKGRPLPELFDFGLPLTAVAADLEKSEVEAIEGYVMRVAEEYEKAGLSVVAEKIRAALPLVIEAAKIAKGVMDEKKIAVPALDPNEIGFATLEPWFIQYTSSPTPSEPAYTDYQPNSWFITIYDPNDPNAPRAEVYLLGKEANFWNVPRTVGKRMVAVIFGLLKQNVGTSGAKIHWFKLDSERMEFSAVPVKSSQYAIPVGVRGNIYYYYYDLPKTILVWPESPAVRLAMRGDSGEAQAYCQLIGFVFYEAQALQTIPKV